MTRLLIPTLCLLAGCASPEPAELIFENGNFITLDAATPEAEAVAVRCKRIVAVGDRAEIVRPLIKEQFSHLSQDSQGFRVVALQTRRVPVHETTFIGSESGLGPASVAARYRTSELMARFEEAGIPHAPI